MKNKQIKSYHIICYHPEIWNTLSPTSHTDVFAMVALRGYCTSYQKLACFVLCLKITNTFLKNKICILWLIVQRTQKWPWNFSRQSGFSVKYQNSQNDIWINNSITSWPTLILMPFLSSLDILQMYYEMHIFEKDVDNYEIGHKTG